MITLYRLLLLASPSLFPLATSSVAAKCLLLLSLCDLDLTLLSITRRKLQTFAYFSLTFATRLWRSQRLLLSSLAPADNCLIGRYSFRFVLCWLFVVLTAIQPWPASSIPISHLQLAFDILELVSRRHLLVISTRTIRQRLLQNMVYITSLILS